MTPKEFYEKYKNAPDELEKVCKQAETSVANFKQIALFNGSVGRVLAKRLALASGGAMSVIDILYPNDSDIRAAHGSD